MEAVRNPLRQVHCGHRFAGEVRRIEDHQVGAVTARVIHIGDIPAVAFVDRTGSGDEYRLAGTAVVEGMLDSRPVAQS